MNNWNGKYVIVRTSDVGVFAGTIVDRNGTEIILENARRIYFWHGAATLSQLAMEGTIKPELCKFPCEVDQILLTGVGEIIPCTPQAIKSIKSVPIWKAEKE